VDLHLGTFGKAFGVYGAYVAGGAVWVRYLLNAARSFVFTTALPPAVIGAVDVALDLVREADHARVELRAKASAFRDGLRTLGLDTQRLLTQIVPAVVGGNVAALALGLALSVLGVLAGPLRPPPVPGGGSW